MKKNTVIILGAGHLAYRLKKCLHNHNYEILHSNIDIISSKSASVSLVENLKSYTNDIDLSSIAMVYLLDDKDENNLQLIIYFISTYPHLPVTASLFNENIIPHLKIENDNLKIFNPARIAAPSFVEQLNIQIKSEAPCASIISENNKVLKKHFSLLQRILLFFTFFLLSSVTFFHFYEHLSWIDSFYFVIVTAATVGYGDINLATSKTASKLAGIFLIIISTISIWMIFSLTIDMLLKKRIQHAMGRKKYTFKNHVIVCGLGRLGYFIVEELLRKNEKVIVIEQNENSNYIDYFRQMGAEVYVGDARLPKVMNDVNVLKAKALISVISNDSLNLEIGLNARSQHAKVKLILRIFDDQMADKIKKYLKIYHILSASSIADDIFFAELRNRNN
ncbi:MAG: potassium channel family protein [Ferruginibacter sp.]|nr:potassium channel family protein [Ferruginibacter sp.]